MSRRGLPLGSGVTICPRPTPCRLLFHVPFQIKYDKSRFPMRQKREDGTWGCRGCGEAIPKNRKAWHSRECADTFEPSRVLYFARLRDKEICAHCGIDCAKAYRDWKNLQPYGYKPEGMTYGEWLNARPPEIEYDHIKELSEGGLTILANIQSLCHDCHVKKTTAWRRAKTKKIYEMDFAPPAQCVLGL